VCRAGFSLLELLVALVVTGAITLIGFGALGHLAMESRAGDEHRQILGDFNARAAVREWIVAAYADSDGTRFEGVPGMTDGIQDDMLRFVTRRATPFNAGPTEIVLRTDLTSGGSGAVVADLRSLWDGRTETLAVVHGARGMSIRYLQRGDSTAMWLDGWNSAATPPAAVRILIHGDSLSPAWSVPLTVLRRGR
jgi:prepilin-type N-terminal cleavage/methylation domain-containing protein